MDDKDKEAGFMEWEKQISLGLLARLLSLKRNVRLEQSHRFIS